MMAGCVQLDMECASSCYHAAQMMSMGSHKAGEYAIRCAAICNACAAECSKHENEHCRECAEACRACAEACMQMSEPVEAI